MNIFTDMIVEVDTIKKMTDKINELETEKTMLVKEKVVFENNLKSIRKLIADGKAFDALNEIDKLLGEK